MMARFSGKLSKKDFAQGMNLASRKTRLVRHGGTLVLTVILVGFVVLPLVQGREIPWLVLAILGMGVLYSISRLFLRGEMYEKYVGSNKFLLQEIEGEATEEGVVVRTDMGEWKSPWEMYFKAAVAKEVILLYQSPVAYQIFPKRYFHSEEDWQAFCRWVVRFVPAKGREKPVVAARLLHGLVRILLLMAFVVLLFHLLQK